MVCNLLASKSMIKKEKETYQETTMDIFMKRVTPPQMSLSQVFQVFHKAMHSSDGSSIYILTTEGL